MDELACALAIDPVELQIRNPKPVVDRDQGRSPVSTVVLRALVRELQRRDSQLDFRINLRIRTPAVTESDGRPFLWFDDTVIP
jgi:hypothetical protein